MTSYNQLIKELKKLGYLKSPNVINSFKKFERKYFVPKYLAQYANDNRPLSIGYGQTISQPLTVAFMIEKLKPQKGNKILEIGSGSGWQTAILSGIVGNTGHIYAYEIIKSLADFGLENIKRFKLKNISISSKDFLIKSKNDAPYDRIISGAGFKKIPDRLIRQLNVDGILVAPTQKGDIRKIVRINEKEFKEEIYPGFAFVPITH